MKNYIIRTRQYGPSILALAQMLLCVIASEAVAQGATLHPAINYSAPAIVSPIEVLTNDAESSCAVPTIGLSDERCAARLRGDGARAIFTTTSPKRLNFGAVPVGQTEQQTFSFTNTGSDTMDILSIDRASENGFNILFARVTIPPHQRGTVVFQFAPTAEKTYATVVSFVLAHGVVAPTLRLSGRGTEPLEDSTTRTAQTSARDQDAGVAAGTAARTRYAH
ncbi:MAG: hypothetical protein Q8922_01510 [Bacteroidota bacterium]|nr:hypothetical protein [Bacteroidota bacterium]MDP4232096.1 hypothetical protein [Bacteroidota bacterium]MDP4241197.1 hypothetical protein [Bacteroidota bacterium]MDP4286589.1 hypothetical protein [Bacteroidota bacterium]